MADQTISETILGKDIEAITYQDVEQFFTKDRSENIRLEFKSYVDEKDKGPANHLKGVYESISGMLNSEGGVIVWGAPEGVKVEGSKEKVFRGSLTHVKYKGEDDQMNSAILDNLSPMPPKVKHRKLTNGKEVIYLFEVPQSPYAPHQFKGTYFARFNASTRTAPHYLVEALMRKVTFPNIGVTVKLLKAFSDKRTFFFLDLWATCENHSRLQNERDLVFTAFTSDGDFPHLQFREENMPESLQNGRFIILHRAGPQLHYGSSRSLKLNIRIPLSDFVEGKTMMLQVSVAGRYSPMKYSIYKIRMSLDERDMSKLLEIVQENSLATSKELTEE